jgi:peptidoglycan-associated lipoprotein
MIKILTPPTPPTPSRRLPGLVSAALCAGAIACSTQAPSSPPPELPDPGPDGTYERTLPQPPPFESRYIGLQLGAELDSCRVEAPKFFFDGTEPRPQDQSRVRALADCLNLEKFADTQVMLVGHADPRGTEQYNKGLSMDRAETVRQKLIDNGVNRDRIQLKAAGEEDAKGDQPNFSYGYDRRVDVIQIGLFMHP